MKDVVKLLKGCHQGTVDVMRAGVTRAGGQTRSWGHGAGEQGSEKVLDML